MSLAMMMMMMVVVVVMVMVMREKGEECLRSFSRVVLTPLGCNISTRRRAVSIISMMSR